MSANSPKNHRPIPAQVVELEKAVTTLTSHVERLQGSVNYLTVVNGALVRMMGDDAVQAKIDEMHLERLAPIAEQHVANTAKAVADGKITLSDVAAPSSIVVAVERNQRGVVTNLRAQIALPLVPELHPVFVGKVAGDTVSVTRGEVTTTYELLEVYEPTPKGLGQSDDATPAENN